MPEFKVTVSSESPDELARALDAAGIRHIGPGSGAFGGSPDPREESSRAVAIVTADDAEAAAAQVREAADDGAEVGPVEPHTEG